MQNEPNTDEDLTTAYMLGRHDGRKDADRGRSLPNVTGSNSLDLFESWEQYAGLRVKGYTLRNGTSVMTITFFRSSDRKPSDNQIETIAECLKSGWSISAIHFDTEHRHADHESK